MTKNSSFFHKFCFIVAMMAGLWQLGACKKYLDKKPSQSLAQVSSLNDLQLLLNNEVGNVYVPAITEFVADNYYLPQSNFQNLPQDLQRSYVWDGSVNFPSITEFWTLPYQSVYNSNFVLSELARLRQGSIDETEANNIEGIGLFFRAFAYHQLAQVFCPPYTSTNAALPGLVLRLNPEVETNVQRSTVAQTYERIVADLKRATELLPAKQLKSIHPNKAAAWGMLSRVYLSMMDYTNAGIAADNALQLDSSLMDFNQLTGSTLPDPFQNPEISFLSWRSLSSVFSNSNPAPVDSVLYNQYAANDLRKSVFFYQNAGLPTWKGSYQTISGNYWIFPGMANDEIILNRAECRIRQNDITGGLNDLNTLLVKRWKSGTFTPLAATSQGTALNLVLAERRKELCFRNLRWSDLRRLNADNAGISLKRVLGSSTFTLPANDLRWTLLIPQFEISRSGIPQNAR